MQMSESKADAGAREWTLEKESELRFEVDESSLLRLRLLSGTAEICGAELALGVRET